MSGKTVNDYEVLVIPRENLLGSVAQRTQELLDDVARSIQCDVRLSPSEQAVLAGVRTHLSNKEIGAQLNTSERNVKRKVTALFRKFKVRNRVSLMSLRIPIGIPSGTQVGLPVGAGKRYR
jgi:DNA-binding NarL/FixJ family response regulator